MDAENEEKNENDETRLYKRLGKYLSTMLNSHLAARYSELLSTVSHILDLIMDAAHPDLWWMKLTSVALQ